MAAAAGAKKELKVDVKIDVFSECKKEDKDWALGLKGVSGKCKPIPFKDKAEVDPRKWTEAKLNKEAESAGVMGLKLFSQHIVQFKEELDKKKKDEKTIIKELIAEYDVFSDKLVKALSLWLEELASGKADNAGALKDGKAAMGKIGGVEFKGAFDKPLKACIDALKKVLKGGKVDPKELANAKKALEGIKADMAKTAKEARNAIDFLLKTGKKVKDDKDAAASLKKFGRDVLQYKDEFKSFLGGADDFDIALDDALKAAGGEMDEDTLKDLLADFESLGPLEDAAQDCLKIAKQLTPQFKAIEKELK